MYQKLLVDGFKCIEEGDLLKFNESFIKNYDENCDKEYILEVDVEYPKNISKLHSELSFYQEKRKLENVVSLFVSYKTKKTMMFT